MLYRHVKRLCAKREMGKRVELDQLAHRFLPIGHVSLITLMKLYSARFVHGMTRWGPSDGTVWKH